MAVTVSDIVERFDTLASASAVLVQRCIDEATLQVNPSAYGDKTDHAIVLLAAHKVAMCPGGEHMRLDPKVDRDGHGTLMMREFVGIGETLILSPVMG